MARILTNNEMAKAFGGYDFMTPDMRAVCKAQDRHTLQAVGKWLRQHGKFILVGGEMISLQVNDDTLAILYQFLKKGEMPK